MLNKNKYIPAEKATIGDYAAQILYVRENRTNQLDIESTLNVVRKAARYKYP